MREIFRAGRTWRRRRELRDSYDRVMIGGGGHGLSTAYHLGRLGVGRAVLEDRLVSEVATAAVSH